MVNACPPILLNILLTNTITQDLLNIIIHSSICFHTLPTVVLQHYTYRFNQELTHGYMYKLTQLDLHS